MIRPSSAHLDKVLELPSLAAFLSLHSHSSWVTTTNTTIRSSNKHCCHHYYSIYKQKPSSFLLALLLHQCGAHLAATTLQYKTITTPLALTSLQNKIIMPCLLELRIRINLDPVPVHRSTGPPYPFGLYWTSGPGCM
jgi:hypothetical protein